jgi:hypothetical protein
MNLTVLLVPLERLGLVDSWRISYGRKGTLEGMIIGAPEDNNRQLGDRCNQIFNFLVRLGKSRGLLPYPPCVRDSSPCG